MTKPIPSKMVTNGASLAGYSIVEHLGLVLAACDRDMPVFRSSENRARDMQKACVNELRNTASEMGANALVNLQMAAGAYQPAFFGTATYVLHMTGDAVVVKKA